MELLKQEKEQLFRTEENLTKDQQLQFLQQTMQGMQQQLLTIQEELNNKKSELEQAKEEQSHTQALLKVLQEQVSDSLGSGLSSSHLDTPLSAAGVPEVRAQSD